MLLPSVPAAESQGIFTAVTYIVSTTHTHLANRVLQPQKPNSFIRLHSTPRSISDRSVRRWIAQRTSGGWFNGGACQPVQE